MSTPLNVLFVCTANICRSAYADVRARSWLADRRRLGELAPLEIDSAGTWGWDAQPIEENMGALAAARGSDPSGFASERLVTSQVQGADVILTAAREHRIFILEDWPGALAKTYTLGQFAESLDLVEPGLHGREAIAGVRAARHPARPAADVVDPYRRGPQAAAECADHIDDLLARILPRLAG